ncbi:MAG: hypothetical protein WD068_01410 [Candidatus Babeliales bacterium]
MKKIMITVAFIALFMGMTTMQAIVVGPQPSVGIYQKLRAYSAFSLLIPVALASIGLKCMVSSATARYYISPVFNPLVNYLAENTQY